MRRIILSLVGALLVVTAATTSASAAPPIDVNAEPGEGGVTVTATVTTPQGTATETIITGQLAEGLDPTQKFENGPGLCATGDIHNSCTPASEAAPNK
jgi:hypothetical protein